MQEEVLFMCGRYLFNDEKTEETHRIIQEINDNHKNDSREMKIGEVYPTNMVPIIINSNNERTAELYNSFIDKGGNSYESFVIITTEANEQMSAIQII